MFANFRMTVWPWCIAASAAYIALAGCGNATPARADREAMPGVQRVERDHGMTAIEIEGLGNRWTAQIVDTPAGRDFLAQLPMTLALRDYAGTEKVVDLPRPLTRKGAPAAITPVIGDITFYAPWGNLAIFYKDGHQSPGLIPLGRIDGGVAALASPGSVDVTIRRTAP